MKNIIYEDINPSFIENTIIQKIFLDGIHETYAILPCEDYVLHDKLLDFEVLDPITYEPTGDVILGFYQNMITVKNDYDFTVNPREFYAVLKSEVNEGKCF